MAWVAHVFAHPGSEVHVRVEGHRRVAAMCQASPLCIRLAIQQADRDAAETVGRRRGEKLTRSDRVAGKQEVTPVLLYGKCVTNYLLGRLLAPHDVRKLRDGHELGELDAPDLRPERVGEGASDGRLADPTGAGQQ